MRNKRNKAYKLIILMLTTVFAFAMAGCGLVKSDDIKPHLIDFAEKEENPIRPIDSFETKSFNANANDTTVNARLNEMLLMVKARNKPDFETVKVDTKVKTVYDRAIGILNRYIKNDFTDFEKIHAIHDYLTYYIKYDEQLYLEYESGSTEFDCDDDSFNLTGVFLNQSAVCDGFSKAFSFMCAIEGIECVEVEGTFEDANFNINHKWNKVKLESKWYNVDTTMDSYTFHPDKGDAIKVIHHGFFMVSDKAITSAVGRHTISESDGDYPSNESYDFYSDCDFDINGTTYDTEVTTKQQLLDIFKAVKKAKRKVGKLELKLNLVESNSNYYDDRVKTPYSEEITEAYKQVSNKDFIYDAANGSEPFKRFPGGVFVFLIYK